MRVIITNCILANRTGAELFVHDLAFSLKEKGHSIIAFAPIMGELAEELKTHSIECTTDLASIHSSPDIIISNSYYETVACLARFPDIPAISVCHDSFALQGQPPKFSRIFRYVAVDKNCHERVQQELNFPENEITIIQNGVDLARFQPRSPLPSKPLKAAIFSNYATDSAETQAVQKACSDLNINLDIIGLGVNKISKHPEKILSNYDLVFAKARCAMEAIAVGCAVILLNEGVGFAGLVTSKNVKEWHPWNFGKRLFQQPINVKNVSQAIKNYSAEDAAIVSNYIRAHATLTIMTNSFEHLIQSLIDEAKTKRISSSQENIEFSNFLIKHSRYQLGLADEHLKLKLHVTEAKLKAILESTSWQITQPLRSLIIFLKRKFK